MFAVSCLNVEEGRGEEEAEAKGKRRGGEEGRAEQSRAEERRGWERKGEEQSKVEGRSPGESRGEVLVIFTNNLM